MTDNNQCSSMLEVESEPIDPIKDIESTHNTISRPRRESIDILSSSLDNIVTDDVPSASMMYHKDSDANALLVIAGLRKESDASAMYSLTSMRKDSDASALSALVKDEEEMMQHEEDMMNGHRSRSNSFLQPMRKNSDPLENLRKLSDASDAVSALRKLSEGSDPLKMFRKDSDGTLGEVALGDLKTPESGGNFLVDLKMRFDSSKDDGSVGLFENPNATMAKIEPTPVLSNVSEHLDALASDKESDDGSASTVTMNDANQKMLMDALLGTSRRNRAESWGGMSDISAHQAALMNNLAAAADISTVDIPQGASPEGFEGVIMSPRSQSQDSLTGHLHQNDIKATRWSGSVDIPDRIGMPTGIIERERLNSISSDLLMPMPRSERERALSRDRLDSWATRDRLDSIATRDRLDSWTGRERMDSIATRDRLDSWTARDRLDSIATRGRLDSLANLSGIFSKGRDRLDSLASLGEVSLTMSIGDLEDVAGKLEQVMHEDSDMGDSSSELSAKPSKGKNSLPAPTIQVDSEAVQSAVQAAMAATSGGILDMLQINTPSKNGHNKSGKINQLDGTPLTSNMTRMEEVRAKARVAAGYTHPALSTKSLLKAKKRYLSNPSHKAMKKPCLPTHYSTHIATPKLASGVHMYSDFSCDTPKQKNLSSSKPSSSSKGGQSNQKWEEMFVCLVLYVKEQRDKETQGMSEDDETKWEWSGNVPTMYKTSDGKALGRWINNQRSAKSKGSLKPDREDRLIGTGLKWSVLTTNAWTDMMEELKTYVNDKTKDGKKWDGNVPTNYKIKTNGEGVEGEEDKNLGRWINRQRSLYQAGKLKDDRRVQLEEIGLKWAVLSTTSWHTMYDALCKFAIARRTIDENGTWDGNVPASYETDDKPPKKLGRWINRQRSAFANKKLKKEFIEKLERSGMKWTASDSKKDIENEVLIRQRVLVQAQRGVARPTPQTIRSGMNGARPIGVASSAVRVPGTAPRVIPGAVKFSSSLQQKGHPSIASKVGAQKVVLPARAISSAQGRATKVIIPARSVNISASKVIIPARSLAQHAAANASKLVIPARSAGSASKVIIPSRSLALSAGNVSRVPARSVSQMQMGVKRVAVPSGSVSSTQPVSTKATMQPKAVGVSPVVPSESVAFTHPVSTKSMIPLKTAVSKSKVVSGRSATTIMGPTNLPSSGNPAVSTNTGKHSSQQMSVANTGLQRNIVEKTSVTASAGRANLASNQRAPSVTKPRHIQVNGSVVAGKSPPQIPVVSQKSSAALPPRQAPITIEQVQTTAAALPQTSVMAQKLSNSPPPKVTTNALSANKPVKIEAKQGPASAEASQTSSST